MTLKPWTILAILQRKKLKFKKVKQLVHYKHKGQNRDLTPRWPTPKPMLLKFLLLSSLASEFWPRKTNGQMWFGHNYARTYFCQIWKCLFNYDRSESFLFWGSPTMKQYYTNRTHLAWRKGYGKKWICFLMIKFIVSRMKLKGKS